MNSIKVLAQNSVEPALVVMVGLGNAKIVRLLLAVLEQPLLSPTTCNVTLPVGNDDELI